MQNQPQDVGNQYDNGHRQTHPDQRTSDERRKKGVVKRDGYETLSDSGACSTRDNGRDHRHE